MGVCKVLAQCAHALYFLSTSFALDLRLDDADADASSFAPSFLPLGCGRSDRNTTLALLMTYVWMYRTSISSHTSCTLTTLWYEDLRIWWRRGGGTGGRVSDGIGRE